MANPFLTMEFESSVATTATNDAFSNPFLVEDDDDEPADFTADNPFSSSNPFAFADESSNMTTSTATDTHASEAGANLFLVEDDNEEPEVDATMSFFGTTINEHDGLQYQKPSDLNVSNHHEETINSYLSEDETKTNKPPRPNPPSQVTQQLITNLTDHLDATSTNLLGKLPVTRSPSPVSMRDLHSPSPTPDVGDLLDVSESFAAAQQAEDNSFAAALPHSEQKPTRPPPPRPGPPPRPIPPSLKASPVTAPTPVHPTNTSTTSQAQLPQEDDLFNFFGTGQQKKPPPKPPAPKSKEDILSLFAAPTQAAQPTLLPDLMSEDIDFTAQSQPESQTPVAVVQPYEPEPAFIPQAIVEPMVHQPEISEPIEYQPEEIREAYGQTIPTIEMDLTPDQPRESDDDEPTKVEEEAARFDVSPESGITSGGLPDSASGSILNMQMQETPQIIQEPQEDVNPFAVPTVLTPPEQLQQLQFLQEKSSDYQYQRPTTPDPIVAQPELAPIFGGPLPAISPAKPAPPRPPARGGSVLTSVSPVAPVASRVTASDIFPADEFDDFSAKFESKSQPQPTGNAFLDSLPQPEKNETDAWGDSGAFGGNTVAVDDGFGNDEDGFDTWDVPEVPESSPYMHRRASNGSDDGKDFSVVIKPKEAGVSFANAAPILGPPPPQRSPYSGSIYSEGELHNFIDFSFQ